ncbi:MAG TPA: L,D-transpeptidase family protein [Bryobacteraceae bacterium]|nr:L,D-transpeptidase family protein [Bryobacteraceae bacterium]
MHQYERTLRALEQYRVMAENDDGALLAATDEAVEPGAHYADTPRLIRLLTSLGDLPADAVPADSDVYDSTLVEAVKHFQSRHGLEPDGVIGKATLAQLNTPLRVRVRQLERAAELWRRRPYDPARAAIVLNVPEFRLRAFDAGGEDPDLDMKIVVGQAPDHETPLLRSHLEEVIFRPYWNVPASIQLNELVPEIARDPKWVSANHFEMVTPGGEVVGDGPVSGNMLSELSDGELALRQKPGPTNTLGSVKFLFPNPYGIYMHDTSAKSLFSKVRRDLSHGCIRVERPADLAEWILRKQGGWTRERIAAAMRGKQPVPVKVGRPIQLVTMYCTAVVMGDGEVHFLPDIYGEDAASEGELTASPGARVPVTSQ